MSWWNRDKEELPILCPKCRSPYWNKKRTKKLSEEIKYEKNN